MTTLLAVCGAILVVCFIALLVEFGGERD